VGNITTEAFARFNLDSVFMGTHGMDIEFGFSSPNLIEADTNREVIRRAAKFVVLVDHTKWGIRGFTCFAELSDADSVITTDGLGPEPLRTLQQNVKEVLLAKP